jgi:alpha-ketoglutarate-dependent taurine dioxygenase
VRNAVPGPVYVAGRPIVGFHAADGGIVTMKSLDNQYLATLPGGLAAKPSVDSSPKNPKELLTAIAMTPEHNGSLFAHFCASFEVDEFVEAANGGADFALINSSDGPVSVVAHAADCNDRSARTDTFDFHNDGLYLADPPDYCALCCLETGRGDIPTVFVDSRQVMDHLKRLGIPPEALARVRQTYVDRRGRHRAYDIVRRHPRFGFEVLQYFSGEGQLIAVDVESGPVHSVAELEEIRMAINDSIDRCELNTLLWSRGDFVVWDNYTYLHARPSTQIDRQRKLARFWLRKLPQHQGLHRCDPTNPQLI